MSRIVFPTIPILLALILFPSHVSSTEEMAYEYVDDSEITAKVVELIAQDPEAVHLKIDVDATGGNVMLMGHVNSKTTEERLKARIRLIRGVKSVRSLLKIKEEKGLPAAPPPPLP